MKKKVITTVVVIVVILALIWVAQLVVANIDVVGLLKRLHGG
jgi:hypothetical protein